MPRQLGQSPHPDRDLPSLYFTASETARRAQDTYVYLYSANLALLVAEAFFSSLSYCRTNADGQNWPAVASAFFFVLTLFASAVRRSSRAQSTWFYGRALAEAVKSMAWRLMTNAGWYRGATEQLGRERFLGELEFLRKQGPSLTLTRSDSRPQEQITQFMDDMRNAPLQERVERCRSDRLDSQRTWYAARAKAQPAASAHFYYADFAV